MWIEEGTNVWFVHIVKRAGMYRNGGENRMLRSPGRQIAGKCKFFMNELNKSASGDTIYWIIS